MKHIYHNFILIFLIIAQISCGFNDVSMGAYTPGVNKSINIEDADKTPTNFVNMLIEGMALDSSKAQGVRLILSDFEQKKVGLGKNSDDFKDLVKEREGAYRNLLTPIELAQMRFIKLRFYNFPLKGQRQVTNIQKSTNMTDGETLKYIEIVERFKLDKDRSLMNQRLKDLLGNKYQVLVSKGIFYR